MGSTVNGYPILPYMATTGRITMNGGKYNHFLCVVLVDGANTLLFFAAASAVLKTKAWYITKYHAYEYTHVQLMLS